MALWQLQEITVSHMVYGKLWLTSYHFANSLQFARNNPGLLASNTGQINSSIPDNDSKNKKVAAQSNLYQMAKVNDFLVIWQGSENLYTIQKTLHTQNKHMTAMGYIPDTVEIVRVSWLAFKHDGVAAFKLT